MIKLFELRTEKGLSQREIAKLFSVSQSTYNNWENSNTQPSIEQLIEIARFFGVSVDYLIGNSDDLGEIKYNERFLSSNELKLLQLYNSLSSVAQKNILDFMKNINL
ncbi:MAG: helix-turn-helix transcriptional regulator [Bacteroides sp.]|nr:helix-turn-helix transcriptional regulator [Bacillota bacterium]MCM1393574.1 helix-turn-helix transcriptional regulator [[Eubacterium] siraeum]MCM1455007.1 helix-turn-helix transcriptional regulator [Bacteroides sp.]